MINLQYLNQHSLDRQSALPLYFQLKKVFLNAISNGQLKSGDMLPSEAYICELCDISRITVRQALCALEQEGFVTRSRGKGTFVSLTKIEEHFLNRLESFNTEMQKKGITPSTDVLTFTKLSEVSNPAVYQNLELPESAPVLYLERVRYADGIPVVYVETYLPYHIFPTLAQYDLSQESLYDLMKTHFYKDVTKAQRALEAVNASKQDAEKLRIKKGDAICLVKSTAYTKEGIPVEYSIARYRGDSNTFHLELYR